MKTLLWTFDITIKNLIEVVNQQIEGKMLAGGLK